MVQAPLLVKGPPERAGQRGGVADEQQPRPVRGHHRLDSLVDGIADALGFVHHNQHVLAVEALELVGAVGGDAHGVPVVAQVPAGIQQLALQHVGRVAVQAVNLPPQDETHLPEGGRGAEDYGRVVGVQEPQDGHRRTESLAQPVARLDGHAPVLGQGAQHLQLLVPQVNPQYLPGKLIGQY